MSRKLFRLILTEDDLGWASDACDNHADELETFANEYPYADEVPDYLKAVKKYRSVARRIRENAVPLDGIPITIPLRASQP